ncbi:MAG: TolC family protein [Archangium sp.]
MTTPLRKQKVIAFVVLLISGCASMSSEVSGVERTVLTRSPSLEGLSLPRFDVPENVPEEVAKLLDRPLTAEDAVRVAMLANRDARASLAELGIARGAYVQAGLLPNPMAEMSIRDPGGPQPIQLDLGVDLNVTATILTPLRSGVAEAVLDAERLKAAGALLDLGYRTRLAFFDVQAASRRLELRTRALESWQATWETTAELEKQGNLNGMDVANTLAQVELARVQVAEAENSLLDARENLTRKLGLQGRQVQYSLAGSLEAPTAAEKDELSEAKAIKASLELAELLSRVEAASRKVGLAKVEGWMPDLVAGFHGERDANLWELGAHFAVSLPILDQQQGRQLSAKSEYDMLRAKAESQALSIRSAVRQTLNRLESSTKRSKHYGERLLPARQKALKETVLQYNAMQLGVFQVLAAQRSVTETELAQVDAMLDAARAKAAMTLLLAGRVSPLELGGVPTTANGSDNASGGH